MRSGILGVATQAKRTICGNATSGVWQDGKDGGVMYARVFFICVVSFTISSLTSIAFIWGFQRGLRHAFNYTLEKMKRGELPFFSIAPDAQSITCHVCGRTSYNPNDVQEKYCGFCRVFHQDRSTGTKGVS
jgi:ribosomal protein L37E